MPLPNPGMDFTPFDVLTAAELDDLVENIESLADGTGFDAGAVGEADLGAGSVTNAKLSTAAGELGGAWATWVPSWTNVTVGDGTQVARYHVVGETTDFSLQLTFGSTTAITGTPTLAPPVAAFANASNLPIGQLFLFDTSTGTSNQGQIWLNSSEQISFNRNITATGANPVQVVSSNNIAAAQPWTWAVGDQIAFSGRLQTA